MARFGSKIDRRRLPGSKWTALAPSNGEKHFEVLEVRRDDSAVVVCVLTGRRRAVSLSELADAEQWRPGWY